MNLSFFTEEYFYRICLFKAKTGHQVEINFKKQILCLTIPATQDINRLKHKQVSCTTAESWRSVQTIILKTKKKLKTEKIIQNGKLKNFQRYAKIIDIPFNQRSLIHRGAWFPPCFVKNTTKKYLTVKLVQLSHKSWCVTSYLKVYNTNGMCFLTFKEIQKQT